MKIKQPDVTLEEMLSVVRREIKRVLPTDEGVIVEFE